MEKKNTILLTVIAVATLLVAVVGATFAYFTASVQTTNESNNTTRVKTKALASAVMDMGSNVSPEGEVYPGYKVLKTVKIAGSLPNGVTATEAEPVNAVIKLTPNVTDFGSHIKYKLYKATTAAEGQEDDAVTCTEPTADNGTDSEGAKTYAQSVTCTATDEATLVANGEGTFNGTTPVTFDVVINYNTKDTYYLVVEYENDTTADQNSEQGKEFSVKISFEAKA